MPPPLKLLIVGPKEAGKTTIANFLCEQTDRLGGPEKYQPTIGVRILELEKNKTNVELWDVSGDQVYEACWPAVTKDAHGVILVYNPESHVHESGGDALGWNPAQCSSCLSTRVAAPTPRKWPSSGCRPISVSCRRAFDSPNVFKTEFDRLISAAQTPSPAKPRYRK
ncbi:hypothetical protein PINS_up023099 [Pythium insidiosum]|nr:hypothetical protein PINS_up023099 [Pythium insidiosum]